MQIYIPFVVIKWMITVTGVLFFSDTEVTDHIFKQIHSKTAPYDYGMVKWTNKAINNMHAFRDNVLASPGDAIQPIFTPLETIKQIWFGEQVNFMKDHGTNTTYTFMESESGFSFNNSNSTSYNFTWSNETNTSTTDPMKVMYQLSIIALVNEINHKDAMIQTMRKKYAEDVSSRNKIIAELEAIIMNEGQELRNCINMLAITLAGVIIFAVSLPFMKDIYDLLKFIICMFIICMVIIVYSNATPLYKFIIIPLIDKMW
jgi:hypothetical protein